MALSKQLKNKMKKEQAIEKRAQKAKAVDRFYNMSSILGNDWAIFYALLGSRMTGKSYAAVNFLLQQKRRLGENCKNYWLRISETSTKALIANNANKLVDPDLARRYNLKLKVKAPDVYNGNDIFCTVLPLSRFAKDKGVAFFDKDFKGWYNIVLDEFQIEEGEKRTSFDILYNFIGVLENIARTTKTHIRIFLISNTLQEASSILKAFNFLPHKFGRYYLKSKRCVIDNMEPTEEYLQDRKGSIASLLGGDLLSNYTNELTQDQKLICTDRLKKPQATIKFGKDKSTWFTLWDGKIIRRYRGEGTAYTIAMRPYLDEMYNKDKVINIYDRYDAENLYFTDLISHEYFKDELIKLRKRA